MYFPSNFFKALFWKFNIYRLANISKIAQTFFLLKNTVAVLVPCYCNVTIILWFNTLEINIPNTEA